MNQIILKPDRQWRITLPAELRSATLIGCQAQADGSVLLYPLRVVREYPSMDDLPSTSDLPAAMQESLERSLASSEQPIEAASAAEALEKLRKRTT